jgi:hypothetical protein
MALQTARRFINRIIFVFEYEDYKQNGTRSNTRKRSKTSKKPIKELGLLIVSYHIQLETFILNTV